MNKDTLLRLQKLNQLQLTEAEEQAVLAFFEKRESGLSELEKIGDEERSAKFVCAICAVRPDGERIFVRGESEGVILKEQKGEGGFGYDPVFYCPAFGKTFAEMTSEEKNSISHRGRAVEKLAEQLDFFKK
jgi:XTP/dITP diphosphohydrolase